MTRLMSYVNDTAAREDVVFRLYVRSIDEFGTLAPWIRGRF